jgi:hypothetical protein
MKRAPVPPAQQQLQDALQDQYREQPPKGR